ncbi:MAG: nicotinate-nucleotide adenylyltransferase [Legionellales bacterium]|nr:nicotinate-nucleotide adenylyltransferase [Legionellales bacterium]
MRSFLIYGGTFDPPHQGHLKTAITIQHHLPFKHFLFLPCKTPLLKQTAVATPLQRIHMLKLVLKEHKEFSIDTREITRNAPSYMVDTLTSFREELGDCAPITLCLGMDAFLQLPAWHAFEKILTLSHLLVLHRANFSESPLPESLQQLLSIHETFSPEDLFTRPCGKIYRLDAGHYPISSSQIRDDIRAGKNVEAYLPARVASYIFKQNLYCAP